MFEIENHWLLTNDRVSHCPSPNFGPRPDAKDISLLVFHNISLPPGEFGGPEIEQFFTNQLPTEAHPFFQEIAGVEVSAHLLIRRGGEVIQFVGFDQRAWHAGQSCYAGRDNCNDYSLGIELEGTDTIAYEEIQYKTLAHLVHSLLTAYPSLASDRVVGHSDIAPDRKTDPGPSFDWGHYHELFTQVRRSAT